MHILLRIIDVLTYLAILIGVVLCIVVFVAVIRDVLRPRSRDEPADGRDESSDG